MRIRRVLSTAALLAGVAAAPALLGAAASPALADSTPSASPSSDDSAPTEAGTSFRTATEIEQGVQATVAPPPVTTCTGSSRRTRGSAPP